jgi:hypothetical protein
MLRNCRAKPESVSYAGLSGFELFGVNWPDPRETYNHWNNGAFGVGCFEKINDLISLWMNKKFFYPV